MLMKWGSNFNWASWIIGLIDRLKLNKYRNIYTIRMLLLLFIWNIGMSVSLSSLLWPSCFVFIPNTVLCRPFLIPSPTPDTASVLPFFYPAAKDLLKWLVYVCKAVKLIYFIFHFFLKVLTKEQPTGTGNMQRGMSRWRQSLMLTVILVTLNPLPRTNRN